MVWTVAHVTLLILGLAAGSLSSDAAAAELLVSRRQTDNVLSFDATTGALNGVFASGGGLDNPQGLVFGSDGSPDVASGNSDEVLRYDGATGAFIDVRGDLRRHHGCAGERPPCGENAPESPGGVVFGPDGNLYVAGGDSHNIVRFDPVTRALIDEFVPPGTLSSASFLIFTEDAAPVPAVSPWGWILLLLLLAAARAWIERRPGGPARTSSVA